MVLLGLDEDMSLTWNKRRLLKYLRARTKEVGSWKLTHKDVYIEIFHVLASWSNEYKAEVLLGWFGNIGKNGDSK